MWWSRSKAAAVVLAAVVGIGEAGATSETLHGACSIYDDTIVLDSACVQTGVVEYSAAKQVRLSNGFSYRADSSGRVSLSAYTEPKRVEFTEDRSYVSPSGDFHATEGYAVGEIAGCLDVSSSGAAVYTIDLELPAGPNGFKPDIRLVYNSQGGHGTAGWQWDLSGLSSIQRSSYTKATSSGIQSVHGLNYAVSDFSLDGMELCMTASGVWRTLLDNRSKIVKNGDGFRVAYDNGNVAYYGMVQESRSVPVGAPSPLGWYVNSM